MILEGMMSQEEQNQLIGKLYQLLRDNAIRFNGCDSTSMTVEKAQDILESLLYTLQVFLNDKMVGTEYTGGSVDSTMNEIMETSPLVKELLEGELKQMLLKGQQLLESKRKSLVIDWKMMCEELPAVQNVYYRDSIRNLKVFFERYEVTYAAHHIPCEIDYWPMIPMPDELKGVSYIEEYVRRIQIENDFVNQFDYRLVERLYSDSIQDYKETLFNLCEPVLVNAIGKIIVGRDVKSLLYSELEQKEVVSVLYGKSPEKIRSIVENSTNLLLDELKIMNEESRNYIILSVAGLESRLYEAVKCRDVSRVFT